MSTVDCHGERLIIDPDRRRTAIVEVIGSARERLQLSIFRCDDRAVLDAIVHARARGVRVDVLMTRKARRNKGYLRLLHEYLMGRGVTVHRSLRHSRYHAKFIVADERLALVSSANFTSRCFTRTSDFIVVTRDADVASGLTLLFDVDRQPDGAAAIPGNSLGEGLSDRLIVGPDHARTAFAALVAGARRSIRLVDRKFRDPAFRALLAKRQSAGVDVRVLEGRKAGPHASHGKLCVIDGTIAIIGSTALDARSLDRGRELSIRVERPALVAELTAYFDAAHAAVRPSRSSAAGILSQRRWLEDQGLERREERVA